MAGVVASVTTWGAYILAVRQTYRTKWSVAIVLLVLAIFFVILARIAVAGYLSAQMVAATNKMQEKSLDIAKKTLEKTVESTQAISVEGIANKNGRITTILLELRLAPGSSAIALNNAKIIWTANGGRDYEEYSFAGTDHEVTLGGAKFVQDIHEKRFVIVENRTEAEETPPDAYVRQGEAYVLAFNLQKQLEAGMDWQVAVRVPYMPDVVADGIARDTITPNAVITLKGT